MTSGDLLPLALACFLLGAVETAAIGQMFAEKHGYRLDSNQEFLAVTCTAMLTKILIACCLVATTVIFHAAAAFIFLRIRT